MDGMIYVWSNVAPFIVGGTVGFRAFSLPVGSRSSFSTVIFATLSGVWGEVAVISFSMVIVYLGGALTVLLWARILMVGVGLILWLPRRRFPGPFRLGCRLRVHGQYRFLWVTSSVLSRRPRSRS